MANTSILSEKMDVFETAHIDFVSSLSLSLSVQGYPFFVHLQLLRLRAICTASAGCFRAVSCNTQSQIYLSVSLWQHAANGVSVVATCVCRLRICGLIVCLSLSTRVSVVCVCAVLCACVCSCMRVFRVRVPMRASRAYVFVCVSLRVQAVFAFCQVVCVRAWVRPCVPCVCVCVCGGV